MYTLAPGLENSGYAVEFTASRNVQHYILKVILPLVLIVMMSWAVFWIDPVTSNSQISIAVTSMLTLIAYRFAVDSQLPLRFSQVDEPEPNIAVLRGRARDFVNEHPHTAVLIVEVADSSLRFDRGRKAELYAENKIEDYWIIDLKKRCVEIHRQPTQDTDLVYRYGEVFTVNEDSAISPLAMPKSKIKVGDILP